jgi:signal transduction histidine kinase
VASSGAPALDVSVERAFPSPIGVKTLVLNARRLVDADDGEPKILLAIEDATERRRAQALIEMSHRELEGLVEQRTASLQALSADLMRAQDNDRRRVARELHDSIGQKLALAKLAVDTALESAPAGQRDALSEIAEALTICWNETRTISHLLHPPILDELGFAAAATVFVTGFSERSGVHVNIRLPRERVLNYPAGELVLFRVLQEGLTNVHRHSGSSSVEVDLTFGANDVTLSLKDHGMGIPTERLQRMDDGDDGAGLGLKGMRERVRELGGHLQIESDRSGTLIRATVPRRGDTTEAAANSGS